MNFDRLIAVRNTKSIYRDGDKTVKVFGEEYAKSDILNEALNQSRVELTGLNIPKILEIKTIDGKWAIVSEHVYGKTLAQLMSEAPEKADEYLELFVKIQIEVQNNYVPLLNKLKDKMNRKISETDLDATTRYDLHTRLESMSKGVKLCHGDFNPTNIIIDEAGDYHVIDWSHATQGNPAADVARTYLLFCLNEAKDEAEKYLDLYCKATDTAKQQIQSWLPIVAASQSVKGNPAEREFLLSWVGVVDYQ